jgi:hypothetical protein
MTGAKSNEKRRNVKKTSPRDERCSHVMADDVGGLFRVLLGSFDSCHVGEECR